MKLQFSNEWLRAVIAAEPDDASYEAGSSHPEAPRFFIDHGVIHDKLTGKHVRTDEFEDGIQGALNLLSNMDADIRDAMRAVLFFFGPEGALKVCDEVIKCRAARS